MKNTDIKVIDKYIEPFPKEVAERLQKIRELVHKNAPEAEEVMSYGMPAFKLDKKVLIYFAGFKEHIGIYPFPSVVGAFKKELEAYKTSKSTIQLQHDEKLPIGLIEKVIKFRVKEHKEKLKAAKK